MIDYGYGVALGDIPVSAREWRNFPEIRDICRENDYIQPWDQAAWLESLKPGNDLMYGIYIGDNPLGVCGLTNVDLRHGKAEYSFYICPNSDREAGLISLAALRTLLRHGFASLRLNRIWGEIFEFNEAALKISESLGFVREGLLRQTYWKRGHWINSIIVAMTHEDYERRNWK